MRALTAIAAVLSAVCLPAQSNTIPGVASQLASVGTLVSLGREGAFPNGRSGLSMSTTVCNNGTVPITWIAPMDPQHPMYAYLVCRESNGRFEQVSERSWIKHSFASANSNFCGTCIRPPNGSRQVGINCSDTYGSGTNGNRFWIGPPEELDPWLNVWNPICSYFDRGDPAVSPPQNCDGVRSLTSTMANSLGPVAHRIVVTDADLNVPGAAYWYAGMLMVLGESATLREDNLVHRAATPQWNGTDWDFVNIGPVAHSSILNRWSGATVGFGDNGTDDGRVYVAVKVTPLGGGQWHYEYAVHNRDNHRGVAAFRVPICPTARVTNAGSRDIDQDPLNDWTVAVGGGEVAFLAGANNALEWNSIFNFWFDCDAAPDNGAITLDAARIGPGALQFPVSTTVPRLLHSEQLGDGCGAPAPRLRPNGTPGIPNPAFGVRVNAHPTTGIFVFFALAPANASLGGGCFRHLDSATTGTWGFSTTNSAGVLDIAQPIPNVTALEGLDVLYQAAELWPGGPAFGSFNLTNGLRIRVGNNRTRCP